MKFPEDYPFNPPSFTFNNPFYHVNNHSDLSIINILNN